MLFSVYTGTVGLHFQNRIRVPKSHRHVNKHLKHSSIVPFSVKHVSVWTTPKGKAEELIGVPAHKHKELRVEHTKTFLKAARNMFLFAFLLRCLKRQVLTSTSNVSWENKDWSVWGGVCLMSWGLRLVMARKGLSVRTLKRFEFMQQMTLLSFHTH